MSAHLVICILSRESPSDAAVFGVTALLPGGNFGGEQDAVWQAPNEALAIGHPDRPVSALGLHRHGFEARLVWQTSSR